MGNIFIGPLRHWLLIIVILGVMWLMGANQFHTSHFSLFLLVLIGLSLGTITAIILTYRKGERITRDSLDDDE